MSVDSLVVNWTAPTGKVSNYIVTITGDVYSTQSTTSLSVTFSGLLPGRSYTITIQTVSGDCNNIAPAVTEATYPSPPGSITIVHIGTNKITLSWGEPINMVSAIKSYSITYWNSSSSLNWTVTSTTPNVILLSLTSGSNYTISVVTVGVRGYQSTPVIRYAFTKPMPVTSLQNASSTTSSVALVWNKPFEDQSFYSYRVQTIVTTSSTLINNTIVISESANIMGLTAGETYTIIVYTRIADNVTESDPVSLTTCTLPGQASAIIVDNYRSVDSLVVNWTAPAGKVSKYIVSITGNVNVTLPTTSLSVTFSGLLPGRDYTITIQTVSGDCTNTAPLVIGFTYPNPPGGITLITSEIHSITLSWGEPVDMTRVTKSYIITYYWDAASPITVTSNITNVTLLNLQSWSNYTITVVAVGVRGYQSIPVSRSVITTDVGYPTAVVVDSYDYTDQLIVDWTAAEGNVEYYIVAITGDVSYTTMTTSTTEYLTGLLPGRQYNITVTAVSRWYHATAPAVLGATFPSPPGNVNLNTVGTNHIALSWDEPINMTKVTKLYNITFWSSSSVIGTWTSSMPSITLQSLMSGTIYTISLATVGTWGYHSLARTTSVCTRPLSVTWAQVIDLTSDTVYLNWTKPDEYQSSYSYRVQTIANSTSEWIDNTIVTEESATIGGLTAGETYTFRIYTRAADGVTESDPVSLTTCTVPREAASVTVTNDQSADSLVLNWTAPAGKVSYYTVTISGDVNNTIHTGHTHVTFTGLSPGREYNITVQTVSGDCSSSTLPVMEATYASPPGDITFNTISTDVTTLSWGEPVNMTGVTKSYSITYYWDASSPITVTSNSPNVTLLSLISGSNYTITVVTVGVRGYQSIPVSSFVFTKPWHVIDPQISNTTSTSATLSWSRPDEYQSSYSYRVQTIVTSSSAMIDNLIVTNESATIVSLMPGRTYTFRIYTRAADDVTESDPVSLIISTKPTQIKQLWSNLSSSESISLFWTKPDEDQNTYSYRVQTNVTSSSALINNIIVTNESATIGGLTAGQTYTFRIYTRAADNVTESDPVSLTTCTVPGEASAISVSNFQMPNALGVTWIPPHGRVSYYNVSLTGDLNVRQQTNSTQVTFTGLSPGREYTVTVQTVSGDCSQTSPPVMEATYPTPPGSLNINTIATDSITLSWSDPVNMTGVMTSFYITYWNSSSSMNVISNTPNITLRGLSPGTNYTISVVTVGVRGYQSAPVTRSVNTSPEETPGSVQVVRSSSGDAMDVTFPSFDTSNGPLVAYAIIMSTDVNGNTPTKEALTKTYSDFKSGLTRTYVTSVIEQRSTRRTARSNEISARVGDGTVSRGYVNGPLDPALPYRVSIAGFTAINFDPDTSIINEDQSTATVTGFSNSASPTTTTTTTTTATPYTRTQTSAVYLGGVATATSNSGAVAGGVVGGIVGVSALGALGYLFWRKKRQLLNVETDLSRSRPVKTEDFPAKFDKLKANHNDGMILEFNSLQSVGSLQLRSVALNPANAEKNRLNAVVPYDTSRVKLSTLEDSADGYINASYIPGNKSSKFIAAQNPLPNTVRGFWYMIWEKQINTIVMLSNCRENGKVCSEEYWPSREAKSFGDKMVTFISDDIRQDWTVRNFMVANVKSNESRQVRQFHFTSWSNNCDIEDRDVFIEFVDLVRRHRRTNPPNYPTLVHCSSGAGRSGIFIGLDRIINQLEEDSAVDVYGIVHNMNLHRPLMMQTEDQYILLYQLTSDIIQGPKEGEHSNPYETSIRESLYEKIPNISRSRPTIQDEEGGHGNPYEKALRESMFEKKPNAPHFRPTIQDEEGERGDHYEKALRESMFEKKPNAPHFRPTIQDEEGERGDHYEKEIKESLYEKISDVPRS